MKQLKMAINDTKQLVLLSKKQQLKQQSRKKLDKTFETIINRFYLRQKKITLQWKPRHRN